MQRDQTIIKHGRCNSKQSAKLSIYGNVPKLRRYAKGQIRSGRSRIEVPICDERGEIIE